MNNTQTLTLPTSLAEPDLEHGELFFIGTATVLLRFAGLRILTDPNFLHRGDHIHVGFGLRATRRTNPAIEIGQLPPIDLVVLSHLHEDHFDPVAEKGLPKATPIVTTHQAADYLRDKGFTAVYPVEHWETFDVTKGPTRLRITAMPGRHGPGPMAKLVPPVMGSLLDFRTYSGQRLYRMYISGDTLVYDDLKDIPRRFPGIDLALLHLGGTRVMGLLLTMDAKQGVEMLRIIAPCEAIPIHYNDYTVFKSPLEDFVRAVEDAHLPTKVTYLRHGDTFHFDSSLARASTVDAAAEPPSLTHERSTSNAAGQD